MAPAASDAESGAVTNGNGASHAAKPEAGADAGAAFVLESKGTHAIAHPGRLFLVPGYFGQFDRFQSRRRARRLMSGSIRWWCRDVVARGVPPDDGDRRPDGVDAPLRAPRGRVGGGPHPALRHGRRHLLRVLPHVPRPRPLRGARPAPHPLPRARRRRPRYVHTRTPPPASRSVSAN
jgi:hypothetical protein